MDIITLTQPLIKILRLYVTTLTLLCASLWLALHQSTVMAAQAFQSTGIGLSQGDALQAHHIYSGSGNAAALAANHSDKPRYIGLSPSIGFGIEYGNVDNVFALVDQLAQRFSNSDPDGSSESESGSDGNGSESSDGGDIGEIKDQLKGVIVGNVDLDRIAEQYPELEATIENMGKQAAIAATMLAIMSTEFYAKANAFADIPVVIGPDALGGSWSLNLSSMLTSKIYGLSDPVNLDTSQMLNILKTSLESDNIPEEITFAEGLVLRIDKDNGDLDMTINNDSLLRTKVARIDEFALNYSKEIWSHENGLLYLGVKPKYYQVGLSQAAFRLGDITDTEEIFDELKNTSLVETTGYGLDVGLIWKTDNYYIGTSFTDINEPNFDFPSIDTNSFIKSNIINILKTETSYTIERQLKLSAGLYSPTNNWAFNFSIDANKVSDPMHDEFQWLSIGSAYRTQSWLLPSVRLALRSNLVGSELTYVNAGMTLFKVINLDISSTLDTVEIEGEKLPRGFALSFGCSLTF